MQLRAWLEKWYHVGRRLTTSHHPPVYFILRTHEQLKHSSASGGDTVTSLRFSLQLCCVAGASGNQGCERAAEADLLNIKPLPLQFTYATTL